MIVVVNFNWMKAQHPRGVETDELKSGSHSASSPYFESVGPSIPSVVADMTERPGPGGGESCKLSVGLTNGKSVADKYSSERCS
jgi:hypothetical protein